MMRTSSNGANVRPVAQSSNPIRAKFHDDQATIMLGKAAAGLAHDIANVVFSMRARLDRLETSELPLAAHEDAETIHSCVDYLASLAQTVAMMATPTSTSGSTESEQRTDLQIWWQRSRTLMRSVIPRHVQLYSELEQSDLTAPLEITQLTRAVVNLVHNAGEALAERPDGRIQVWATRMSDRVVIGVTDNGPGLPVAFIDAEEARFTTKSDDAGHGVGLAIVREVVDEAGGELRVRSTPHRGCTFMLVLPTSPASERNALLDDVADVMEPQLVSP